MIDQPPRYVCYQGMVHFAHGITERSAGDCLNRTRWRVVAFRPFEDEL